MAISSMVKPAQVEASAVISGHATCAVLQPVVVVTGGGGGGVLYLYVDSG